VPAKRTRTTRPKQTDVPKDAPPAAGNGADQPTSAAPAEPNRRTWLDADLVADIKAFAADRPDWPLAKIAAEFGQPMKAVRYLLPGRD
jgi:hypothetical protein